jgi:hypothetical protein
MSLPSSRILQIGAVTPEACPLGGVAGFAFSPSAADPAAPFPLTVFLRRGTEETLLFVRSGKFYRLSRPVDSARAVSSGAGGRYQLDVTPTPGDEIV